MRADDRTVSLAERGRRQLDLERERARGPLRLERRSEPSAEEDQRDGAVQPHQLETAPHPDEEIHRLRRFRNRLRGIQSEPAEVEAESEIRTEGRERWQCAAWVAELACAGTDQPSST